MRKLLTTMAFIGVAALGASGCATEEELSARDAAQCRDFGFAAGTEAFANCRLQLYTARTRRPTVIEQPAFPPAPRVIVVPEKK